MINNRRRLAAASALALGILVGCQGGDGPESYDSASTAYAAETAYGGHPAHPISAETTDPVALQYIEALESLVNKYRNSRDLDGLQVLPELRRLAQAHSLHMGSHVPAFFSHVNPEGDSPELRAGAEGIEMSAIGENIAAGHSAAEAVFRSWLESPAHRANLEDPRWTHMGAGHAYLPASPYVTYWTLDLIERR